MDSAPSGGFPQEDVHVETFSALARRLRLSHPTGTFLIGIDGHGGAGKSTFGRHLARVLGGCPTVHTDDFADDGGPLNAQRFLRDVLEPLTGGRDAAFRCWDWGTGSMAEAETTIAAGGPVIVEGVSSTRLRYAHFYALRIFVCCPEPVRLARGLERDGDTAWTNWQRWIREENGFFGWDRPWERAELIVDGCPLLPCDATSEFVALGSHPGRGRPLQKPRQSVANQGIARSATPSSSRMPARAVKT